MKNITIINAYIALMKIGKLDLPIDSSFDIFKLRKALKTVFDFYNEQEQKIIENNGGVYQNDGTFIFKTKELAEEVFKKIQELKSHEAEVEYEPVTININTIQGGLLSPDDIDAVDGFVIFVKE